MIQKRKEFWLTCVFLLAISLVSQANVVTPTATGSVLQHGFPTKSDALITLTEALKNEYEANNNVIALVFYAYGLLRQADRYATANDFIHASEYAKSGFFWLDEAVERHDDNLRVRYLRARVDAYLPANSGRCEVTIKDTERMLSDKTVFTSAIRNHIYEMRYRALHNCRDNERASQLKERIRRENTALAHALTRDFNVVPEWDSEEITQVLFPLVKGE
jgi:hypothetical protein